MHSGHVAREDIVEFERFTNCKYDEGELNQLMDYMDLDKDGFVPMEAFLMYFAKVRRSYRLRTLANLV